MALSKTEKTSTVRGGDSVLFVVLRYVSIRFISFHFASVLFPVCLSFSADCVSHCPLTPYSLRDASVLTHKFALICCKIISFIYVLPFTWRYAVDNLFKRRHRRGATNLNKINYQTVTLTYRPGSQAARQAGGGGRLLAIQLPRSKSWKHNLEHHVARLKDVKGWPYIRKASNAGEAAAAADAVAR